jgi:glycosyltransferase involved in cell wall biosynthesis
VEEAGVTAFAAQQPRTGRRPRVLVVSLGRRGGTTRYGQLMSIGLARHADIAVISAAGAENRTRWDEIDCPHLEVETFSSIPTMLLSFLSVRRFARIRRFARSFAPDIVYYPHGHAWKPLLDLLLPRAAGTVLTIHDPELHAGEDSVLHRLLDGGNRIHVDAYVLLNESQREGFIQRLHLDPARVRVIPHGIFDDLLQSRRPLSEVPGLESLAPWEGRHLLFAGRIVRYKGLGTLLAAYATLSADPPVPLVIAGDGELSDEESALLDGLTGRPVEVVHRWLSDVELASLVGSARFVVLPYLSATQSGVIPLASAFGVPAIASDTGGIAEQVQDGATGMLFAPGDEVALRARLEGALAMSDAAYAEMSSRCRSYAETAWSWDVLAKSLLSYFATIVASMDRER